MKKIIMTLMVVMFGFTTNANAATKKDYMTVFAGLAYYNQQCTSYGTLTSQGWNVVGTVSDRYSLSTITNDYHYNKFFNDWVKYGRSVSCKAIAKALPQFINSNYY